MPNQHTSVCSIIVWMSEAQKGDKNEVFPLHQRSDLYASQGIENGGGALAEKNVKCTS